MGFQRIVYTLCRSISFKKIKTLVKIRQFSDFPKLKPVNNSVRKLDDLSEPRKNILKQYLFLKIMSCSVLFTIADIIYALDAQRIATKSFRKVFCSKMSTL